MSVYEAEVSVKLNKDGFDSDLKSVGNSTEQAARSIDARAVAIGNVISQLATKAGQFFVQGAQMGIQYNAQIETYTTALTTALGNEADAAATIEKIKQDAARTPYSVDSLVQANSYLIQAGDSAEAARNTIMALGDAVAATGGGNTELQRMAQNLQQVKNVGKATSMDIKQFAMAGIDVYGILADYTGKTRAEVQELTITYDLLSGALQAAAQEGGKYYNAMERQSQTLNGQISTLKDNIQQKLGDAFKGVADTLSSKVLPKVNEFVSSFDMDKVTNKLGDAAKAITAISAAVATVSFVDWVTDLGNVSAAFAKMAPLVKDIVASFQLASEAGYLTAFAGVGAILGIAAVQAVNYANSQQAVIDHNVSMLETSGQVQSRMIDLKNEYANLKEAADAGIIDPMRDDRMMWIENELAALRDRAYELSVAEDEAAGGMNSIAEDSGQAGAGMSALADTTKHTTEEISALIDYHSKLHSQIEKSVNKWFGLFDKAKTDVKVSTKDMMANMQSQIDFNTKYSANLDYLAANGMSNLGSAFQSMGAEGAAYADALVQSIEQAGGAASEGGQEIINSFNSLAAGVESSRGDLTTSLYSITGDLESTLAQWGVTAEQAAEALNVSGSAGAAAAASVAAYIAGISAGSGGAYSAAAKVARSASAGFSSVKGGATPTRMATGSDYIPYDDFPALLHKGEMVIPAKISEDLRDFVGAGGKPANGSPVMNSGVGNGEIVGLLRELIAATKRPIVLDDGTLVGHTATKMDNALGDVGDLRGRGLCLA